MTLPSWDSLPIRTKRSRKRLYGVIANEYSLTAWNSLPHNVKRSKKHLYNYIASQKNLEEYDELAKNNMRSTRLLYTYIKENASGSKPTLTVKVKDGEDNVSGATVTIGTTEKTTDASGETTYSLDYDNYTIEVEKTGYEDYTENIKFRANHKTFTIPLEPTLYKVTVTAKDGSANALSNATVNIKQSTTTLATGKTGTDGKVELNVRAGTFTLEAESSDETLAYTGSLTVDGDETETITLTSGGDTGTVTVTCQEENEGETYPSDAEVYIYTGDTPPSAQDDSMLVAYGHTDETGVAEMTVWDTITHQATEVTDIPFGTYNLYSIDVTQELTYTGSLIVDGDESETITLTKASGTGTVTVTCQHEVDGQMSHTFDEFDGVKLSTHSTYDWDDEMGEAQYLVANGGTLDENGTVTLLVGDSSTDVPFGSYYIYAQGYLSASQELLQYSGTLTVDGNEEVTITLTAVDDSGPGGLVG